MNTEITILLLCLLAISICRGIPINKNDVIDTSMNEIDDLKGVHPTMINTRSSPNNNVTDDETGNLMKGGDDFTVIKSAADEHEEMVRILGSSMTIQHRAASLNPETESLYRLAILGKSKLDQVYILVSNLFKSRLFPLNVHLTPEEVDGVCNMNVSQLTSDLCTAITAVCLLDNITETTEEVGGCCHGNSQVGEKFRELTVFLEENVFRFLIKDSQLDVVDHCRFVGRNMKVYWLLSQITKTLQKTEQLLTAIESRQCVINS